MKNILYILILVLYSNGVFGQDFDKLAEGAAKDLKVQQSELAKFKLAYISNLKNDLDKKVVRTKLDISNDICTDGGFEKKDFSNWGWTIVDNRHDAGGFTYVATMTTATGSVLTSPITTDGLIMSSCTGATRHANSKWEIVSAGTDPLIPSLPRTHFGKHALKLGDKTDFSDCADYPWKSAESVQKSILISATNKTLKFWYAVVTNDASTLSDHSGMASSGFGVRINAVFAPIIPVPTGTSNSPILAYNNSSLTNVVVSGKTISYLPWTCASVDLSQYIGQVITVEFMVFDCIHTGHFGYAYIDDICMGCEGNVPPNPCCKNTLKMESSSPIPTSYSYADGTYAVEQYNITSNSSAPITELRVETVSFEWLDGPEDCKQCQIKTSNLGSMFGGISIGGTLAGSTMQPYGGGASSSINNSEVVFSFPIPIALNIGDFIKLTYVLPPDKELSCCNTKAKVCRKISWKDTNFGYCEVYDCSTIDLKNKSELKPGASLPNLSTLFLNTRGIFATGHADGF